MLFKPAFLQTLASGIEFVGMTSGHNNGATDLVVDLTTLTDGIDTQPRENDLVIVATTFAYISNGNPGIVSPSGYTEVADLYSDDSLDTNFSVNYKIMTSSPDTSVTCNNIVSGYSLNAIVYVLRGIDISTPIDVTVSLLTVK